jgi:hypothetical protein
VASSGCGGVPFTRMSLSRADAGCPERMMK